MFDIFSDEKPCLYIADITIEALIPLNVKSKKRETRFIRLDKHPIVLDSSGNFPTQKSREAFMKKVFNKKINKGDFSNVVFKINKIENKKFSSKLMYDFNFDIH